MLIHSNLICSMTPFHLHFTDGETEAQKVKSLGSGTSVSRLINSSAASFNARMLSTAPAFSEHAVQDVVVPKGVKLPSNIALNNVTPGKVPVHNRGSKTVT